MSRIRKAQVRPPIGPLTPIFEEDKQSGSLVTGNTPPDVVPPPELTYDEVIATLGPIWYVKPGATYAVTWPTLATVVAGDYRNETSGFGGDWFHAWYEESGYPPVGSDATIDYITTIWEIYPGTPYGVTWPSLATVIAGDYRNETSGFGGDWFNAWYDESGYPPATYDLTVVENDPIWFSKLAAQSSTASPAGPVGGTISVTGGFRYHVFTSTDEPYFWTMDPNTKSVDAWGIGGGASGGRATTSQYGGGGGSGEDVSYSGNVQDGGPVALGAGGINPGSASQGNNGGSTTFADDTGTLLTAPGGSGGGAPAVSAGVGKTGSGSGGGGAAASGVSGTGGAGTGGGNGGGNGAGSATATSNRAGGGGGASGAGVSGVAAGQTGTGGAGVTPFTGFGPYGGGGAGATGAGTATGGTGGGGNAGTGTGTAGTADTGSGGGGAGGTSNAGVGAGGRFIVRYTWP